MFGDSDDDNDDDGELTQPELRTLDPPLFELRHVPAIGGGRGLYATQRISAAQLILAEVPCLKWSLSDDSLGNIDVLVSTVQKLLLSQSAHEVTKKLYPLAIENVTSEELRNIDELWSKQEIEKVLSLYSSAHHGATIDKSEILRVTLVLQHNGFSSGLYDLLCMLNHSCDPNCIKFSPRRPNGWQCASEIWAIREIAAGDELTICYCDSPEMTTTHRQLFLNSHHKFRCHCARCEWSQSAEGGNNSAVLEQEATVLGLELAVRKAVDVCPAVEGSLTRARSETRVTFSLQTLSHLLEECTNVLVDILQNSGDIRVVQGIHRCLWTDELSLHTRLLKTCVTAAAKRVAIMVLIPSPSQHPSCVDMSLLRAAVEYAVLSCALVYTQERYLPPLHADFTQSLFDVSESISFLHALSRRHEKTDGVDNNVSALSDMMREVVAHFPAINDWIHSKSDCAKYLVNVKSRYQKLEKMYKSTYQILSGVLSVSSQVVTQPSPACIFQRPV